MQHRLIKDGEIVCYRGLSEGRIYRIELMPPENKLIFNLIKTVTTDVEVNALSDEERAAFLNPENIY